MFSFYVFLLGFPKPPELLNIAGTSLIESHWNLGRGSLVRVTSGDEDWILRWFRSPTTNPRCIMYHFLLLILVVQNTRRDADSLTDCRSENWTFFWSTASERYTFKFTTYWIEYLHDPAASMPGGSQEIGSCGKMLKATGRPNVLKPFGRFFLYFFLKTNIGSDLCMLQLSYNHHRIT